MVHEQGKQPKNGFFAVDVRSVHYACQHGVNAATAYIVMAAGTGGDNATTRWSVNAVETHTSISRPRASEAVKKLKQLKLVDEVRGGKHPHYRLRSWAELTRPQPGNLSPKQQEVFERIKRGEPLETKLRAVANDLQ